MPRTQPVTRSLLRAAASAVSAAALLTGCVSFSGIDPKAKIGNAADLATAQALAGARVTPGQWPSADWWTRFGDRQLDTLVREALDGHPSIRAALARVDGAVAIATITGAAQGLGVTASFDNTRQLLSKYGLVPTGFGGRWITTNQLALNLKYEVDFWDRNQSALEAALGQAKAGEAEVQSARLSLASAVTLAYIELARNFEQLDIARATLAQREALLGLARTRLTGGLDSQIDVRQVESTLPEVRTRITQLEQSIAMGRNQIAALLGKGPDRGRDIARPQLATNAVDAALPSQLPADLIGRRPDIVASRWRIEASARDIQSAKAAFYPNINLAAALGSQSIVLSKFLSEDSQFVSFGPALRLPLFNSGTLKGTLAARDAEYDAAVERYNQQVVDALREVVDQMDALRYTDLQRAELEGAQALADDGLRLAKARQSGGLVGSLPALVAEGQVLARKAQLADIRALRLALNVNLIRALGGGNEDTSPRIASTGAPANAAR
jgi:NodT family efflux transporter outer membrane factor (OMF) lipoprotein